MIKPQSLIKSTKIALKFSNTGKKNNLYKFIDEYRNVVIQFIDIIWEKEDLQRFLEKDIRSQVTTWISARAVVAAGKQASGIVRGIRRKQEKRLFIINKLKEENKLKRAKKLQQIYNETKIGKPNITSVNPDLDAKFIRIDLENPTKFDGWITLLSLGYKFKLILPFKKTKHFNKLLSKGQLKQAIRLNKTNIIFLFDIPKKEKKESGSVLGIDIGQTTLISCSNNYVSTKNKHGHDLSTITSTLVRKTKGSKGFKRAESHRTNYINWSINKLNLKNVKQVNIENIKNLRLGKKTSRSLSHWTYPSIFEKLESHCDECGVQIISVNSTYTSQRCSACGWTRKSNRKGKMFKCDKCGFTLDADLNASKNIALPLVGIPKQQRLKQPNRAGFYWNVLGQEPRVPVVQRALLDIYPLN